MLVVDNFHVKIRYDVGFVLSNCLNAKNTFEIQIHKYSIELSVHKQPSVFNTAYTIQCRVNCPIDSPRANDQKDG